MMRSMTGFAHRDFSGAVLSGSIELKSYNNRYLDLYLSLPAALSRFEPEIRAFLGERMNRGKVELAVRLRRFDLPVEVRADIEAARAVAKALREVAEACALSEEPRLSSVAAHEGVLVIERDSGGEGLWNILKPELAACFDDFDASRLREGRATELDLGKELRRLEANLETVRASAPELELSIRNQFEARLAEFLPQVKDESRILAETAVLLVKYGINEEMARLGAHLAAFREIAAGEEAPAKKLDFLCQEMNREVNTIGSKNVLIPVARAVVEMKDALENLREQLRNLE